MSHAIKNRQLGFDYSRQNRVGVEKLILGTIAQSGGITAKAVADYTGAKINVVVARISELKQKCSIRESGSVKDPDSKVPNTLYQMVPPQERRQLARAKYVKLQELEDNLVNDYLCKVSQYTKDILQKEIKKIRKQITILKEV